MRWRNLAWLLLLAAVPTVAQPVVTSAAPEGVAVTIYRAEDRGDSPMNLGWLQGYALITEKRTVTIPDRPRITDSSPSWMVSVLSAYSAVRSTSCTVSSLSAWASA